MTSEQASGGTEVTGALQARAPVGIPRIVAVAGPGAGRALAMSSAQATAGRHPTNDLVLGDPQVSGVHLALRRVGDRVHVRDAGSTNGTWMGPHRITEIELAAGAELTVGSTTLRVERDDAGARASVSQSGAFGELVARSTEMLELF